MTPPRSIERVTNPTRVLDSGMHPQPHRLVRPLLKPVPKTAKARARVAANNANIKNLEPGVFHRRAQRRRAEEPEMNGRHPVGSCGFVQRRPIPVGNGEKQFGGSFGRFLDEPNRICKVLQHFKAVATLKCPVTWSMGDVLASKRPRPFAIPIAVSEGSMPVTFQPASAAAIAKRPTPQPTSSRVAAPVGFIRRKNAA